MTPELMNKLLQFRKDRDWEQFHTPKNLTISLVLEATELMEMYQWGETNQDREHLEEEVADVLSYLLYFCHDQGIDLLQALDKKIDKNSLKYPVDKVKGTSKKYTEL